MLSVRNLSVAYGARTAVDNVTLSVDAGEIVTLVGPTGCGKSSLLRAVAGFEMPTQGEVRLGDARFDRNRWRPPEARRIGLVFQDFALFPHLTVRENVAFRVATPALADQWIERLGLGGHRDALPDTLSGGQKQRVALARTLAHEPAAVLLDEPLSNLDAALKASLRWEIRDAIKAAGVPAIWVTHDQDEALSVGDRMGVMHEARLEQLGDPEVCYRAPVTRFVACFLGSGAFLPGRCEANAVHTVVGPIRPIDQSLLAEHAALDVLVRPHDLCLSADDDGQATILSGRYEGETRLYDVALPDDIRLRVRVPHDQHFAPGARVRVALHSRHDMPAFARD